MPLFAAAAAAGAAGAGGSLFGYNRENFLYDRKMRQETEYQIIDFRIKQAELWREDVRDIIGLTSVKMDTYLIVNAVQLGFTVMAFCEGRLAAGTPVWLVGCHTLSLAGAFMYFLMSVWFAMHASVTAKSYEVRLLTQLVRLPVPTWSTLEGARTYGSSFEKVNSRQMFRVPFAMGTQEAVLGDADGAAEGLPQQGEGGAPSSQSSDLWGLEGRGDQIYELDGSIRANPDSLRHLQLIQQVMQYWQSYDGFARVAMSMGTNQLVTALAYYVIGYVLISNKAVIACFLVVALFMVIATALIRLDMSLTGLEFRTAVVLVFAGPCLCALAAQQWSLHTPRGYEMVHILSPLPYAFSAAWLMLLLYISKVSEQENGAMLPTGFRSVMYIDVFGWIKRNRQTEVVMMQGGGGSSSAAAAEAPTNRTSGLGPAVQCVGYQGSKPLSSRPEQLSGAAQAANEALTTPEMFEPTTFVPREKEEPGQRREKKIHDVQPYLRPGYVPWRIFCSATTLLIVLWWVSGVLMLLQSSGLTALRVAPLLSGMEDGARLEPLHDEHGAMFLLEPSASSEGSAFMQFSSGTQRNLVGEHIATNWPHLVGASPRSLACGLGADGRTDVVASSRFGLFTAKLGKAMKTKNGRVSNQTANFQYAPPCDDLDGEALQDVSMLCGGENGACQALVLHRQGQRLTKCVLDAAQGARTSSGPIGKMPAMMSLSDNWLGEGDAAQGRPQEEVASITMAGRCSNGDSSCAYVETTSGRLVELKTGLVKKLAGKENVPDWFPTRVLLNDIGDSKERQGGAIHMLGNQYLGVIAREGTELRALDPRNGGKVAGRWPLPPQERWTSMCSSSGSLFLLAEGAPTRQPQLWRFPLPENLQPELQQKPSSLLAVSSESPKTSASRARVSGRSHSSQKVLDPSSP